MRGKTSLQGLVRAKFKSVKKLSDYLGWSYTKTYRIVTERQLPNVVEVWDLADALGLETAQEIKEIFLSPQVSTKEDKRTA